MADIRTNTSTITLNINGLNKPITDRYWQSGLKKRDDNHKLSTRNSGITI